ncbi:hypothetical protein BU23DRAFT_467901 [Bimuria novae-zelandiae CBS 107.79]|uniref:HTH psq-type domain-containing protein n=1 Tax=Bimuria novae-zelandiae CBS 107.79 TaxID=1447943 RepID=A0A6A5V8Z6_9PLEO|nr:hypothetical protein BU23DRAFT_467901 [Bimuria novae-zelandiae CBS 107.79]
MGDREVAIQATITDLNSSVFSSQRAAARAYNIAQSTLSTRVNRGAPNHAAHQH